MEDRNRESFLVEISNVKLKKTAQWLGTSLPP